MSRSIQSHPHFDVARRLWDAVAAADMNRLWDALDEKGAWRMYGRSPLAGVYVGQEAVLSFFAEVGERCDEMRASLIDIFVSDEGAVLRYSIRARRGGNVLDAEQLLMTRIEGGKIVEGIFAPIDQEKYDRFWCE